MDPIGFGLENFDAMGRYRETIGSYVINPADVLEDIQFSGPVDLAHIIASDPRFLRCAAEHAFVYGLGRGVDERDGDRVLRIATQAANHGAGLLQIIEAIVSDDSFLYRENRP
jgi:hypothetical protein